MESRDKLLAEQAEIESALPDLESGAVYVCGGGHEAYVERARQRLAELRRLLS